MLTVLRDATGRLEAACHWWLVDVAGVRSSYGNYVWVESLEISNGVSGKQMIQRIIKIIADEIPQAIAAYWVRDKKYDTQKPHAFKRTRLLAFAHTLKEG